uniref:protein transport protein SEC16B homolog isoform X2 n=1 Tax=Erigeron canadensis TaxID=72917 RepID=UPI001CB93A98|nr:protein transport protein SEC16B homolog isoform X2 [Erigeron canadensis]
MAANPLFNVEDTDEDFFDKLVDDDDDIKDYNINSNNSKVNAPSLSLNKEISDIDDSEDAKAFANLSLSDDFGKLVVEEGVKDLSLVDNDVKDESLESKNVETSRLVNSNSFAFDNVEGVGNEVGKIEQKLESENPGNGSGDGFGVKEVQWGAFDSDYPDFFNEFGDGLGDQIGKEDSFFGGESNGVVKDVVQVKNVNDHSQHVPTAINDYSQQFQTVGNDYSQHVPAVVNDYSQQVQGDQVYANMGEQGMDGQDPYPGWKYDSNTGQWYQVDESYNTSSYDSNYAQGDNIANSAFDWTGSNEKSEVSYLQQSAQPVVAALAETGKTENVTSWNSASQTNESFSQWSQGSQDNNKVYPSHMVFDPLYPGWYYDMNVQEWRSLDEYNSQSTVVTQDPVNQNGSGSSNAYYGNDGKTHGGHGELEQKQDYSRNGSFSNAEQQSSTTWQPNAERQSSTMWQPNAEQQSSTTWKPNAEQQSSIMWQPNAEQSSTMWQPNAEQQSSTMWQPNYVANSATRNSQQSANQYSTNFNVDNHVNQQQYYDNRGTMASSNTATQINNEFPTVSGSQPFVPFSPPLSQPLEQNEMMNVPKGYGNQNQLSYLQQHVQSNYHTSNGYTTGRSSAGRPPHALVTFGFGGKLIVMKDSNNVMNASYGGQDSNSGSISVHNLAEVVTGGARVHDYIQTLCQQPLPGPLSSGNVGAKELTRWIDDRITHNETSDVDYKQGEDVRLLLSLLKIGSQHYGKLRSPFGSDTTLKDNDAPEVAVARLFASVKNTAESNNYGSYAHCLQQVPSERQTRETAAEVQTLLVSGRKKEALLRAQEGQLWGPALVLAAQLGDQFYVETVKKMALQLVPGSPLRTLCLLIAGQPADVFAADVTTDGVNPSAINMSQQPTQSQISINGMLDDWEDNLAVITANRTKDDELVLIHLGDCLWKERSNIIAAHICYLVAEASFEPYSDTARLCLIGADHWKHPRTYASPEAIQRTEVYEYSKMLGNSQFTLLPFQPYKLIYAYMLAEVGRVPDSLKYCQAIMKTLKTGRNPEVETWRQLIISLEDRLKTHQQGGFSTNLAPGKIGRKVLNFFDSAAQIVVGGLPPPVPSTSGGVADYNQPPKASRVLTSQSTMAMSSLMPSASLEPTNQGDGNNRMMMHNRSASEPDFGRSPRQDETSKVNSADSQSKASGSVSRFSRFGFGSGLFQKTVGKVLKPRQDKQAKLGDTNKFYYDEKLKRWVEEGVDPPAEEAALAPPPTMATFQNGSPDYSLKSALRTESVNSGSSEFTSPTPSSHNSGIPPIPATSNQFSARGRMGVRARYVDTFNKGGGNATNLFQPPSVPTIKPPATSPNPTFFVPTAAPVVEQPADVASNKLQQNTTPDDSTPPFSSRASSLSMSMPKFASMGDISKGGTSTSASSYANQSMSRRTLSWSGSANQDFSASGNELQAFGGVSGAFIPNQTGSMHSSNDDLQEVEL